MTGPDARRPIRVGMVGSGFMAQQHSAGYRLLANLLGDAVPPVDLVRIAGGRHVHQAARRYGWADSSDDTRAVTEADDIDVVDIVTPNNSHADLTLSAAAHGKHIVCEKPLARDHAEAQSMLAAVRAAGVHATVCFVYRTWPATVIAKAIIDSGRLGRIHGYRGRFLHDHVNDPVADQGWRVDPARAGSGVIGDIGSHALDLARYLVGDLGEILCVTRGLPGTPIDQEADLLVRFASGASGHIWLSWLATGTPMDIGFEVLGDRGAIRFSWARPSELAPYDADAPDTERGFTVIPLGPTHPAAAPYLPVAGIGMSYQAAFVPLLGNFLSGIGSQNDPIAPTFHDGVLISRSLDAALTAATTRTWQKLDGG